jgi:hypothetical protein
MVSYVHIQESPVAIKLLNPIGSSTTAPRAVIAQQYFPATFISLRFHCLTEKLGSLFSYVNI